MTPTIMDTLTFNSYDKALDYIFPGEKRKLPKQFLFNEGIYITKTRVFKITLYSNEIKACKRLVKCDFKNVCKIHSVHDIIIDDNESKWAASIIEQEKLFKSNLSFNHLTFKYIMNNIATRASIAKDILNGLQELNSVGIIYNDLHSSNIMKTNNNIFKIIDFGGTRVKRINQASQIL